MTDEDHIVEGKFNMPSYELSTNYSIHVSVIRIFNPNIIYTFNTDRLNNLIKLNVFKTNRLKMSRKQLIFVFSKHSTNMTYENYKEKGEDQVNNHSGCLLI